MVLNCNNCAIVKAEELRFLSLISTFEPFNAILTKLITGGEIESISYCELNILLILHHFYLIVSSPLACLEFLFELYVSPFLNISHHLVNRMLQKYPFLNRLSMSE